MTSRVLAVLLLALLLLPVSSPATSVQPGIDSFKHLPPSGWDFGPIPIDGDHFGPGSDPFDGGIPADETALPPVPECPGDLGETSMLIERLNLALLPSFPSSAAIDIEIIALSIVANDPIIVTYNGGLNPEEWNVEITLSPSEASTGTMTIRQEHANGGTFDAEIVLQPYFTFTRVSDGEERTLDGALTHQDTISVAGVPWVYSDPDLSCPACGSNFIPGHDGNQRVAFSLAGTSSQHMVMSSCVSTAIPALSEWGLLLATVLLLALGATIIARRSTAPNRAS